MRGFSQLLALLKREILEHLSLWRVPLILIVVAVLVRFSLSFGNLSFDLNMPDQLNVGGQIDSALNLVVAKALNSMNYLVMWVMLVVGIFYSLSCLFNERQDESVLFWRSLPISDWLTVVSKMMIPLVVIPLVIIACQAIIAVIFFGTQAVGYLGNYYPAALSVLVKVLLWSMLPMVSWCLFCSQVARKNPFLLAFIAPILVILTDKLFLNGLLSQTLVINRLYGVSDYTGEALLWGLLISAVCVFLAVVRRGQRI